MLPGKSGVDLCRQLRAQPNGDEMFILLVTARADTADLEQALEAGANDYLTKPLDPDLLNVRISVAEHRIRGAWGSAIRRGRRCRNLPARWRTFSRTRRMDSSRSIPHWNITHLNAEAETLLGRTRDELLGHELWEKFPEQVGSVFEANYRKVMAEQVPVEFEASDSSGKVWYEVHAYPSNGGVSVFFRDISERQENRIGAPDDQQARIARHSRRRHRARSEQYPDGDFRKHRPRSNRSSGGFGSLLGFLSKAGQAAQHAAHLSSQLLTFSKGGTPLKKMVSVGELLEHSAEFSLYGSNLRADFDIAVDLWKAEVDAGQIEQVVNALMLNAREAMPHGGTVRVRARNVVFDDKPGAILPAGHYHQDHHHRSRLRNCRGTADKDF